MATAEQWAHYFRHDDSVTEEERSALAEEFPTPWDNYDGADLLDAYRLGRSMGHYEAAMRRSSLEQPE